MQDYVPYYFHDKRKRGHSKRIIAVTFSVVFFAAIIIFSLCTMIKPKNSNVIKDLKFYFVYTEKQTKKQPLSDAQEFMKKLGGAGNILFYKDHYYLIANVYFSKEEAEEVERNIKPNFNNTGILEITKILSKQQKREISNNDYVVEYFIFFDNCLNEIQNLSMNYVAGKISEAGLCTKVISLKLELEDLVKRGKEQTDSLSQTVLAIENLNLLYFSTFLDNFYISSKKQSLLADLVVSNALSQCELFDNL